MEVELPDLKERQVVLLLIGSRDYTNSVARVLKKYTNGENLKGVYVALNKPYARLKEDHKKVGVRTENVLYIDLISSIENGEPDRTEDCIFLGSPAALTDISIALDQAFSALKGEKFLFLDSLSTLLIYHNAGTVAKFSHFLTTRLRTLNVSGIFLALEKEESERYISQISQFCDKTIDVGDYGPENN